MESLHNVTRFSKFLAIVLFISLPFIGFSLGMQYQKTISKGATTTPEINNPTPEVVACTMDAKVCPDGSAVGRIPPTCDFAECPNSTTQNNSGRTENRHFSLVVPPGWTYDESLDEPPLTQFFVTLKKDDYKISILYPLEGVNVTNFAFYPIKKEQIVLDDIPVELSYSLNVERCLIESDKTIEDICKNNFDTVTVTKLDSDSAHFTRDKYIGSITLVSRMPIGKDFTNNSGVTDFKAVLSSLQFK